MRRVSKPVDAKLLILTAGLLGQTGLASACTCGDTSVADAKQRADVVRFGSAQLRGGGGL